MIFKVPSCYGLAMQRDLLYVAESDGNCVSVYKTNGERLTAFGSDRELSVPVGITVDENGFIYVCSSRKGNIVVY